MPSKAWLDNLICEITKVSSFEDRLRLCCSLYNLGAALRFQIIMRVIDHVPFDTEPDRRH